MSRLSLGDLVDLEARTIQEQGDSPEVRQSRYRHLGRRLAEAGPLPEDPGELLGALLRLDHRPDAPGKRVEGTLTLFQSALALLGLLAGGSLSLGLLHGSDHGETPVNVLTVLAALVGTQLVLLVLLIVALLPRSGSQASGPVQHLLRASLDWLLRRSGAGGPIRAIEDRLQSHHGLLKWVLVRSAQVFGVAFNLGAFSGAFFRFATFDVSFGWSSTLPLGPQGVHRLAALLAAPWSWVHSSLVPSFSMVEATQYSHLEGKYLLHGSGDRSSLTSMTGAWFSFVLLAIVAYGFLPRLLMLLVSTRRLNRILAETPGQNMELARLCEWMRSPVVLTRPEGPDPAPHEAPSSSSAAEPPLPPTGSTCELLEGAPSGAEQALRNRFGWSVATGPDGPLVAVVSAWEEPTKGQLRRFGALRSKLTNRILIVGLFDPAAKTDARRDRIRDRWKRDLPRALDGVRVRVEAL